MCPPSGCVAWETEQRRIARMAIDKDDVDWTMHGQFICGLQRVGGVDISFFPDGLHAVAAVVVLSCTSFEILYERCAIFKLTVPYINGFLAFREVPALSQLLDAVPEHFKPQVVLVDGNGLYHPRRCGAATHLGVATGLPTVGVAKTVMKVGDTGFKEARAVAETLKRASDWAPLLGHENTDGEAFAAILRPHDCKKMLVVSPGHRVSLQTAVQVVASLCLHNIPEPIRQADLRSRARVQDWIDWKEVEVIDVETHRLPAQGPKLEHEAAKLRQQPEKCAASAEAGSKKRQRPAWRVKGPSAGETQVGQQEANVSRPKISAAAFQANGSNAEDKAVAVSEQGGRASKKKHRKVWQLKANSTLPMPAVTGADCDYQADVATNEAAPALVAGSECAEEMEPAGTPGSTCSMLVEGVHTCSRSLARKLLQKLSGLCCGSCRR